MTQLGPRPADGAGPVLSLTYYDSDGVETRTVADPEEAAAYLRREAGVLWLDVAGPADAALADRLGAIFGLHPLAVEDVVSAPQRPKVERYGDVAFALLRLAHADARPGAPPDLEQLGLFFSRRFVLTFRQRPGDAFDPLRARLQVGTGLLRRSGADHLAYALIDLVVDGYFPLLERYGEHIEALEDALAEGSAPGLLPRVHRLRRNLLEVRRAVWPLRDAVGALQRDDTGLVSDAVRLYLRDVSDHVVQLLDMLDTDRELAAGLVELNMSAAAMQTNAVMKVLTIIATVFIPLTFVAGVYGMNFERMPELHLPWGYPAVLLLMLAIALGEILYFRAKGWLGDGSRRR